MLPRAGLGAWGELPFFTEDLPGIEAALEGQAFLPHPERVFAALTRTQPEYVKVLILGQDPYPTPGHANGFAFSVEPELTPLPRSLGNIFKELHADLGITRENGDLSGWADQGVMLLNAVLTVPPGEAHGHKGLGWQKLTAQVLARLDDAPRALLLWGVPAQKLGRALVHPGHLRIETSHPSPLSARHSFEGSRPFSRINEWLRARGEDEIDWGAA